MSVIPGWGWVCVCVSDTAKASHHLLPGWFQWVFHGSHDSIFPLLSSLKTPLSGLGRWFPGSKHETLTSNPQNPFKTRHIAQALSAPVGRWETGEPPESVRQLAWGMQKQRKSRTNTCGCSLVPMLWIYTSTVTHMNAHICTIFSLMFFLKNLNVHKTFLFGTLYPQQTGHISAVMYAHPHFQMCILWDLEGLS